MGSGRIFWADKIMLMVGSLLESGATKGCFYGTMSYPDGSRKQGDFDIYVKIKCFAERITVIWIDGSSATRFAFMQFEYSNSNLSL